jgi:catechol 2,3-dioxygenase-like lactoylglutathione lyase family enzyme
VPSELNAIGLSTKDMAESCRFYRTLGVDVAEPAADADHHEANLPNGLRVMWDTEELIRQIDPGWTEPRGQRITLAFLCADPADVDATYGRAVEAGFSGAKEPWDAFWGQRYAQLLDPDGNKVDLFAPLETG